MAGCGWNFNMISNKSGKPLPKSLQYLGFLFVSSLSSGLFPQHSLNLARIRPCYMLGRFSTGTVLRLNNSWNYSSARFLCGVL